MKTVKRSISGIVGAGTALFLAAAHSVLAQAAGAAPAAPHQHHIRYIVAGVAVVVIIVLIVVRMNNAKKQTA